LNETKKLIEKSFCVKVTSITKDKVAVKPLEPGFDLEAMKKAISMVSGISEVEIE